MNLTIAKSARFLFKALGVVILLLLGAILVFWLQVSKIKLSEFVPEIDKKREARVLTAFFGIDSDLPLLASLLYIRALGKDGMPLVFSHEIDPNSLKATDFEITTLNGSRFRAEHVTLMPANEEFELRTTLLIGEYVRLEIEGRQLKNVYRLPRTALRDNTRIWLVSKDGKLEIRNVEALWRDAQTVLLTDGIQPGEQLIVSDLSKPVNGMQLQVAP